MSARDIVHIIDDDDAVRDSLSFLLETVGYQVRPHASGIAFLAEMAREFRGDCIISDIRMPEMDGLELQAALRERGCTIPLIFMTGHGDVPVAVRALKAGAIDFLEKPFDDEAMLAAVRSGLEQGRQQSEELAQGQAARERMARLTPREHEVLQALVAGNPNKTIAFDLGMSPRTVEVHRARVMEKMEARSLSELVRMVLAGNRT